MDFNLFSKLQFHETLDSTNDYAINLLKQGQPAEGTVIMADFQTKGRGQRYNNWQSDEKSNITLSLILYPVFLAPGMQFYLSMALSLGIIDLLSKYHLSASIKWPNDIYIGRKKIAGILIENAIMKDKIKNSVLGIGLNVNQEEFTKDIPNPASMKTELGHDLANREVLKSLLSSIETWLNILYNKKFSIIKENYEQKMLFRNQWKNFSHNHTSFKGIITGINEIGQLIMLDDQQAERIFSFKEVEYCL